MGVSGFQHILYKLSVVYKPIKLTFKTENRLLMPITPFDRHHEDALRLSAILHVNNSFSLSINSYSFLFSSSV